MGVAGNSSQVLLTIEPALSPHGGYSILTPLLAFPAKGPFFSPGSFYTSSSAQPSHRQLSWLVALILPWSTIEPSTSHASHT